MSNIKTLRNYSKKTYLGDHNGERIYLTAPSWDCGWYWGFGYIGNRNCHYHLDGLGKTKNLHDGIKEHFGETIAIRPSDLWTFSELVDTAYKLRTTAEVLGRGGSHLSSNPCAGIIQNTDEVERINAKVLPAIFDAIYDILERNADNETLFAELVRIDNEGLTSATLDFMKENHIHPDDLKIVDDQENYNHKYIKGLNGADHSRLHGAYWKDYHANKKKA